LIYFSLSLNNTNLSVYLGECEGIVSCLMVVKVEVITQL